MRGSISDYTAHMYSIQAHTSVRRENAQKERTPRAAGAAVPLAAAASPGTHAQGRQAAPLSPPWHASAAPDGPGAAPGAGGAWTAGALVRGSGGACEARVRGLAARCSLRSLDKVRQSAQQSADRSTQRRCGRRLAVHGSVRRWVAPASCWAARHSFLSPLVGAKALDRPLRLCPYLRPPGGRERHRLRCAPPVPGNKPQPGQAE